MVLDTLLCLLMQNSIDIYTWEDMGTKRNKLLASGGAVPAELWWAIEIHAALLQYTRG